MTARSLWQSARAGARRPGTTAVLVGSFVSGAGAYAFQVVGTRALGDEAFAPIGVLWTVHYLTLTIAFVSVEAHVARSITLHLDDPEQVRRSLRAMTVWVVVVAVALGGATAVWRDSLFHPPTWDFPAVVGLTVGGYGVFVLIRGWLAGHYRFRQYAIATGLESVARLAVAVGVVAVAATTRSLAWTLAFGPWAVAVWWAFAHRRPSASSARPPDRAETVVLRSASAARYLTATITANASSQVLLAAGPLVLLPLGAGPAEVSVFFVTITAARVPLVFALNGVLSRVPPALTRAARAGEQDRLRRLAVVITAAAAGVAGLGAAVGSWIGPGVVALFFGADFRPPGWFVALTVAGVVGATAALGLNQLLIAMGVEHRLILPWVLAMMIAAATVVGLDGSPSFRVITAFVAGEAAALVGLTVAVSTTRTPPTDGAVVGGQQQDA